MVSPGWIFDGIVTTCLPPKHVPREVSLLRQHFHPAVSTQAVEAASLKPVVLHKYEAPHALMHQHNFLVSGEFRPPVKLPVMSGSKVSFAPPPSSGNIYSPAGTEVSQTATCGIELLGAA